MNPLCQSDEVTIKCAHNDTCMTLAPLLMQAEEMPAIVRQQNPALRNGERQNLKVGHGRVRIAGFQGSQDVMTQAPQFRHNWLGNILVGIETGH